MENCSAGTWTDPCLYWDAGRRRVHRSAAPPDTPAYRIYLLEPIWPAWCWEEATWPDRDRNPAHTHTHAGSARAYLSDEVCVLRYVRSDIMLCVNRWSGVNHTHFKCSLTQSQVPGSWWKRWRAVTSPHRWTHTADTAPSETTQENITDDVYVLHYSEIWQNFLNDTKWFIDKVNYV